ncbi:MAG: hypothetical protein DCC52_13670 [Chloroflexi bacterium]|nr:MAG: hypothetical protein DCC52_13670 [Chloroflexota bacterium]
MDFDIAGSCLVSWRFITLERAWYCAISYCTLGLWQYYASARPFLHLTCVLCRAHRRTALTGQAPDGAGQMSFANVTSPRTRANKKNRQTRCAYLFFFASSGRP